MPLTLHEARRLNDKMREDWDSWVRNAPDSWKDDGFIVENVPVALTMRYGQNQKLEIDEARDIERENWDRDRDMEHIRLLAVSIAHHILYDLIISIIMF